MPKAVNETYKYQEGVEKFVSDECFHFPFICSHYLGFYTDYYFYGKRLSPSQPLFVSFLFLVPGSRSLSKVSGDGPRDPGINNKTDTNNSCEGA